MRTDRAARQELSRLMSAQQADRQTITSLEFLNGAAHAIAWMMQYEHANGRAVLAPTREIATHSLEVTQSIRRPDL